jgi:hypothetical protein
MKAINCPACGHTLTPAESGAPDPSVVEWFRIDPGWTGEAATDEIYGNYLRATDGTPVSRNSFVLDLAYLGVEEVLDGETYVLVRS